MLVINIRQRIEGFLFVITTPEFEYTNKKVLHHTKIQNVKYMEIRFPKHDFDLPDNVISIFRGYKWPYKNCLKEKHYDLLKITYKNKGMIRKCTHHKGNFEMIGRRRSKQSSGTMFSLPKNVDNHQYYRQTMNTTLLTYVKSMVNVLQAEAIFSNYSSGESLMTLYKSVLDIRKPTELCEQTIITQNGFHNTVHTDIGSCLNTRDTNKVLKKYMISKMFLRQHHLI